MTESVVYRTKFGILFWSIVIILVAACSAVIFFTPGTFLSIALFLAFITLILFIAAIGYDIRYIFEQDRLEINCRFHLKESPIPYSAVWKVVARTKGVYAVWGLSMDCIEIYHGVRGYVCISPANKEKFIETLKESCPQARFEREGRD